jgi:tetratricopeptide (TPR) repeat protein
MLDHVRRAETLAETLGDQLRLGRVYADMGTTFRVAGEVDRAIVYGQRALALAATLGHVGPQARAHLSLGRAMGLCQDWHLLLFLPRQAAALGLAYALDGRVAACLTLVEQGVEQAVAMGTQSVLAPVVACLSEAYLLAGRLEDARQRAAQALDLARQYQYRGTQAWALWLLGESTARQASPAVEPAIGHYRQALPLAEELGMRPLQAHCHRGLGTLYATTGQREQARTALATAADLYRTMDMTFWLPETEAALAQIVKEHEGHV